MIRNLESLMVASQVWWMTESISVINLYGYRAIGTLVSD